MFYIELYKYYLEIYKYYIEIYMYYIEIYKYYIDKHVVYCMFLSSFLYCAVELFILAIRQIHGRVITFMSQFVEYTQTGNGTLDD